MGKLDSVRGCGTVKQAQQLGWFLKTIAQPCHSWVIIQNSCIQSLEAMFAYELITAKVEETQVLKEEIIHPLKWEGNRLTQRRTC